MVMIIAININRPHRPRDSKGDPEMIVDNRRCHYADTRAKIPWAVLEKNLSPIIVIFVGLKGTAFSTFCATSHLISQCQLGSFRNH